MTQRELQQNGLVYKMDDELWSYHHNALRIAKMLNETAGTERQRREELVQALFASAGEGSYIQPPFYCDYGCNTSVGKAFDCNFDCVFLDCGKITIGDNVLMGPKVGLYAVGHPIDPTLKAEGYIVPYPITIGNNVWIGGGVTVCPGVTIGDNSVIGAGSVVTKDIPANVVAAGNPCRVLRTITEEDKKYWNEQIAISQELSK